MLSLNGIGPAGVTSVGCCIQPGGSVFSILKNDSGEFPTMHKPIFADGSQLFINNIYAN